MIGQVPEDRVEAAVEEMNASLRQALLARVMGSDVGCFERLMLDLMGRIGYGGLGSFRRLGHTQGGGVEGLINDVVYLQARRQAARSPLLAGDVRDFFGRLDRLDALGGVLVTTSPVHPEARVVVDRDRRMLSLVDGDELARLLVRHGLGVRTVRTIRLSRIDPSYFLPDGTAGAEAAPAPEGEPRDEMQPRLRHWGGARRA